MKVLNIISFSVSPGVVSGLVDKATELTVISVVIVFLYNGYSWKGTPT